MENTYIMPKSYLYAKGYIIFPITISALAKEICLDKVTFIAKDSFHISILSVKKYAPMYASKYKVTLKDAEEKIIHTFITIDHSLRVSSFSRDIRIAKEDEKETIIVFCKVNGIEKLFKKLRESLDIDIAIQPTHCTLYTLQNGLGIGLTSKDDIYTLTRPLRKDEQSIVKQAIINSSII